MIGRIKRAWDWFVGGLADAALGVLDRATRRSAYAIEIGPAGAAVRAPDGRALATLQQADNAAPVVPAQLAGELSGAPIDLAVPAAWMFRRGLDPVALQSVPFLDAFVRHQIERITPWRAVDVHYQILQTPIAGDATRVGVEIVVVPKKLVAAWTAALDALRPRTLRIRVHGATGPGDVAIVLGAGTGHRHGRIRRIVAITLLCTGLFYAGAMAWLLWEGELVAADLEAQDQVLEARKAVLARARRRDEGGSDQDSKLRDLRRARPRAVDVIEALSRALPDTAHLTDLHLEKDRLTLSGIATDPSGLVPALETSGRFADVAFGAATTRLEAGDGERFHLEMRILAPAAPAP